MIRLAAFAAVLLASSAAFAAPTLRAEALVSAEIVTLGDLADDAGADAGVALFRASDYGLTGAVPADVVIAAARRAGVEDVSAGLVSEIAVTRLGRSVTGDQVMEAIAARAAADLGAEPSAMRVTLDDDRPVHLSPRTAAPWRSRSSRSTPAPAGSRHSSARIAARAGRASPAPWSKPSKWR